MLHLILADSELETVPKEISLHRTVGWIARRRGRRPTEILLDSNYHHRAMRELEDAERRGRPDIAHIFLILALDSPLNRERVLRVYIHTRHNRLISVDPSARIPHAYNRFVGLIEQLFLTGAVPPDGPLLRLEDASLAEVISRIRPAKVITLTERGCRRSYRELFQGVSKDDDVCVTVGGFPHGDFISDVTGISDELVCIDPDQLEAHTAAARAIFAYEDAFDIQKIRLSR